MSIFISILLAVWLIFKVWWWVLLPIVLWRPFIFFLLWWRNEQFAKTVDNMLVELKMPNEVERPFKAMEQVFAGLWMFYDPADFWEKWIEGKFQITISLEIASIEGEIHFYLRFPRPALSLVESSIYAQYPEVEISEVEDYTKKVPQDIPNGKWDLWGTDYEFIRPDIYPLKTYAKFFEESPVAKEVKRIDPLAALLEGLSQSGPGEQIWVQMRIKPITIGENNYKERAKKEVNKLANRPEKKTLTKTPIVKDAADLLILGKMPGQPEEEKAEAFIAPEMQLTPGEREVVSEIEKKVSKTMFEVYIRFIILGEKGKWHKGNLKNVLGFFANFNTENLNAFKPWSPSITKVHKHEKLFLNVFFHDRLLYLKKRKLFKRYLARLNYFFPKKDKTFILNLEELASLYHIVGRSAVPAPMVQRVQARKAEPPIDLPTA